jgi:D-lactate dehydrogenase
MTALARACADEVVVPASTACCGFAGDRGFLVPELTAAATHDEALAIRSAGCEDHVSGNRMCELAMTRSTGRPYRSVISLLDEVTRQR